MRTVTEHDLQSLYDLVKGARYANTVIDAKAALATRDYDKAIRLLRSVRDLHSQSLAKTMRTCAELRAEGTKDAEARARRLIKREENSQAAMANLELFLTTIERMANRDARLDGARASGDSHHSGDSAVGVTSGAGMQPRGTPRAASAAKGVTADGFQDAFMAAATPEEQLQAVRRFYRISLVAGDHVIASGNLYLYRGKDQAHVVRTEELLVNDTVQLQLAFTSQRIKPMPLRRFLELGRTRHLVQLLPRDTGAAESPEIELDDASESIASAAENPDETLDMGTFSQLLDAATRCGLVPNADSIAHVRDREFRLGDYARAFQSIEALQAKFAAATVARQQRLRREETDIKSGKVPMSPKDLQAKRARDTADHQRIERARNKFARVLEGLRILMRRA